MTMMKSVSTSPLLFSLLFSLLSPSPIVVVHAGIFREDDDNDRYLCCKLNCCDCSGSSSSSLSQLQPVQLPRFFIPSRSGLCLILKCCRTASPTFSPTTRPTLQPTRYPTPIPTHTPTALPTATPTSVPTAIPTTAEPTLLACCGVNGQFKDFETRLELDTTIVEWYTDDNRTAIEATYGPPNCWGVSAITDMSSLFTGFNFQDDTATTTKTTAPAPYFDQGNFSCWDVGSVTDMSSMFQDSNFMGDINAWDVQSVVDLSRMFQNNTVYNEPLDEWYLSGATNFLELFQGATAFGQDLCTWQDRISIVLGQTTFTDMFADSNCYDPVTPTSLPEIDCGNCTSN